MNSVFLLLGGNIGNTNQFFINATGQISEKIGSVITKSSLYQTEPWGFECSQYFLNQVLEISTELQPIEILENCKTIEKNLGRTLKTINDYESRVIDIDILFYNNEIFTSNDLIIPHPRLHLRKFTLLPLNEVIPDFIHPQLNKKISKLLEECEDNGFCKIFI